MRKIVVVCLLLCLVNSVFAQVSDSLIVNETSNNVKKHGVGLSSGAFTGAGVTYRYRLPKFGVQGTLGRTNFSLGFLYTLVETQKTNLYMYQGTSYFTERKRDVVSHGGDEWDTGVGLGIEFIIARSVGLSLISGYNYAVYNNIKSIQIILALGVLYTF